MSDDTSHSSSRLLNVCICLKCPEGSRRTSLKNKIDLRNYIYELHKYISIINVKYMQSSMTLDVVTIYNPLLGSPHEVLPKQSCIVIMYWSTIYHSFRVKTFLSKYILFTKSKYFPSKHSQRVISNEGLNCK